jgi:hypothetical protein
MAIEHPPFKDEFPIETSVYVGLSIAMVTISYTLSYTFR